MVWNVNGWTDTNQILQQIVIHHFNPDILSITETHMEKLRNLFIQPFVVQCTKQHISCIKDILDML